MEGIGRARGKGAHARVHRCSVSKPHAGRANCSDGEGPLAFHSSIERRVAPHPCPSHGFRQSIPATWRCHPSQFVAIQASRAVRRYHPWHPTFSSNVLIPTPTMSQSKGRFYKGSQVVHRDDSSLKLSPIRD